MAEPWTVLRPPPTPKSVRPLQETFGSRSRRPGSPLSPINPSPTCRRHYPGGPSGCICRFFPARCSLPRGNGGSASTTQTFEACSAFIRITAAGPLGRPSCRRRASGTMRPLSRGFGRAGCPILPPVSFQAPSTSAWVVSSSHRVDDRFQGTHFPDFGDCHSVAAGWPGQGAICNRGSTRTASTGSVGRRSSARRVACPSRSSRGSRKPRE